MYINVYVGKWIRFTLCSNLSVGPHINYIAIPPTDKCEEDLSCTPLGASFPFYNIFHLSSFHQLRHPHHTDFDNLGVFFLHGTYCSVRLFSHIGSFTEGTHRISCYLTYILIYSIVT